MVKEVQKKKIIEKKVKTKKVKKASREAFKTQLTNQSS